MEKLKTWLAAERGRVKTLAAACKITHSAVLQWREVPAPHVLTVESITGISRHELRDDVFREREAPIPPSRAMAG